MGSKVSITLRIKNRTNSDISAIWLEQYNRQDFGHIAPDTLFNGKALKSNTTLERKLEITTQQPVRMTFKFQYHATNDEDIVQFTCDGQILAHIKQTNLIEVTKSGARDLNIIIQNTEQQKQNARAESLLREAQSMKHQLKFTEASKCLIEAKHIVPSETLMKEIESESFALKTLKATQFDGALKKFDRALNISTSLARAEVFYREGCDVFAKAWTDEFTSREPLVYFWKARRLLQQAYNLNPDKAEFSNVLRAVDYKLEGEKSVKEAMGMEAEVGEMDDSKNFRQIKSKYRDILGKYLRAKKLYEEGLSVDENFGRCLCLVNESIEGVQRIINELDLVQSEQN